MMLIRFLVIIIFIVPFSVYGQSSKIYIKALDEIYNSNTPITHFPAGEVSRKYSGLIQDAKWQKSFINKAISCKRNIVPIHFQGRNSRLFYFINSVRKFLGINLNLELLLLPREMFLKRNKTIVITIGKPISYLKYTSELSHFDWAQKVRSQVYSLKNKSNNNI